MIELQDVEAVSAWPVRLDVQIVTMPLSVDPEAPPDVLAINAASAALAISEIPFNGPIAAVRVGLIEDALGLNPTREQISTSDLDLLVAGTKSAVIMVEAGASEISEAQMLEAIQFGHKSIVQLCEFYEELASRDREVLRAQHVIEKDLEIESKFEDATRYLFSEKLNHSPLKQSGSRHPDGLVSLQSNYLMWDNKSKDSPGLVEFRDHIRQFDEYMDVADKPVPVFLVVGPGFTDESEIDANGYHAQHFDRNIVLITASELKALAEEWASPRNRNKEEPFPLGLLAATGRFERKRLGRLN